MKYQRKSYTTTDFYESYKQYIEPNTPYDIDLQTYKNIINDYFQYIRDEVMYNCKEFKFPCRLGTLQIIKHQPKEFTGKSLRWDWKATKETGKPVYLLNDHSNYYNATKYHYLVICINQIRQHTHIVVMVDGYL